MDSVPGKVLVTGANGFTGARLCRYLAERVVPTRGMYWAPEGVPTFSHPNLELVPGDLLDRESAPLERCAGRRVPERRHRFRPVRGSDGDGRRCDRPDLLGRCQGAGLQRAALCAQRGIFEHAYVQRPVEEHISGKIDHNYRLWLLINLEVWYRMFFEGVSVEAMEQEILRLTGGGAATRPRRAAAG